MKRETWWTVVHRVTQSQTRLTQLSMHISVDSTSHRPGSMWFMFIEKYLQIRRPAQFKSMLFKSHYFFFSLTGTNHLKHAETSQLVVVASLEGQLQWGGEKWKLHCNSY